MSTPTVVVTEPVEAERDRVSIMAKEAVETGSIKLDELPDDLRRIALLALDAYVRGERVTAIVEGREALSTNEAAKALGVSRTHLSRMFDEGRIQGFHVGTHLRIPSSEITRVLVARANAMTEAREAAATADQRRRDRAARAAGL